MYAIQGHTEENFTFLRELTAWRILAETHQDLANKAAPRHTAANIFRARATLAQTRGITDKQAWQMVRDTIQNADEYSSHDTP